MEMKEFYWLAIACSLFGAGMGMVIGTLQRIIPRVPEAIDAFFDSFAFAILVVGFLTIALFSGPTMILYWFLEREKVWEKVVDK